MTRALIPVGFILMLAVLASMMLPHQPMPKIQAPPNFGDTALTPEESAISFLKAQATTQDVTPETAEVVASAGLYNANRWMDPDGNCHLNIRLTDFVGFNTVFSSQAPGSCANNSGVFADQVKSWADGVKEKLASLDEASRTWAINHIDAFVQAVLSGL